MKSGMLYLVWLLRHLCILYMVYLHVVPDMGAIRKTCSDSSLRNIAENIIEATDVPQREAVLHDCSYEEKYWVDGIGAITVKRVQTLSLFKMKVKGGVRMCVWAVTDDPDSERGPTDCLKQNQTPTPRYTPPAPEAI